MLSISEEGYNIIEFLTNTDIKTERQKNIISKLIEYLSKYLNVTENQLDTVISPSQVFQNHDPN